MLAQLTNFLRSRGSNEYTYLQSTVNNKIHHLVTFNIRPGGMCVNLLPLQVS